MNSIEIIGYIGYIAGAIVLLTSKTKSDNMTDLKDRVGILEKEREYSREQHIENQKAIANLEGQLKTYKEIPLQQIADSLGALATNQDKVLDRLNQNAKIAKNEAETGGVLVKSRKSAPLAVKEVTK